MRKYSSYILFLLLAVLTVILFANGFGPLDSAQRSLDDFLMGMTADDAVRPNVAVVQIDGRAQSEFGNWPWNRDLLADLVAATAAGEPKVIVVNVDLGEDARQDSAGYTGILAGQFSWMENVVLPYDIALASFRSKSTSNPEYLFNHSVVVENPLGLMSENAAPAARKVFLPAGKLLETEPYLGFEYLLPDDDRVLRHQPLLINYEGYYYPSLALISAAAYHGVESSAVKVVEGSHIELGHALNIPINEQSEYYINYTPTRAYATYSAADVLSDDFQRERLKNSVVLIGVDAITARESFTTPLGDEATKTVIHAAVVDNFVNGNILDVNGPGTGISMLILFAIGALCAFVLPQVSMLYRFIILGAGLMILANVNYFLFSSFGSVPQTMYIGLELILFMLASPLLDTEFIKGDDEESDYKSSSRFRELASPASLRSHDPHELKRVPVRELKDTGKSEANAETAALDYPTSNESHHSATSASETEAMPLDHQAINIDDDLDGTGADVSAEDPGLDKSLVDADEPIIVDNSHSGDPHPEPRIIDSDSPADDSDPLDSTPDEIEEPITGTDDSGSIDPNQTPSGGIPSKLGRYQITGKLGKGAMGVVYKGVDPAINRPVALKTIRLDFVDDPEEMKELKERLHREAQAAGKLSHPNIVSIFDVGSEGALQYIVMEFLEGRTLEDMIKKKTQFNYRIVAEIIMQICSALQYAHEQKIVHRDIKPANIMILKDYRVKVMDYGIARVDTSSMTKTGIAMGTPNYISPEQLKGQKSDHRADIFSLGVVMYEMLMGRRPFKGENITSLIYSVINNEPDRPSDVNPQVPLLFDHVIMRALQKEPDKRYQKASEIAVDLRDFVESFASGS